MDSASLSSEEEGEERRRGRRTVSGRKRRLTVESRAVVSLASGKGRREVHETSMM
jgi:hypothetical protein